METFVGWIIPIVVAVVTWWLYRRKYVAEVDGILVDSAHTVVRMYKDTFEELKCRVAKLEASNVELRKELKRVRECYQHRIRLLAKVIVVILDACSNGCADCIDAFIDKVEVDDDDRQFLLNIIDEVECE